METLKENTELQKKRKRNEDFDELNSDSDTTENENVSKQTKSIESEEETAIDTETDVIPREYVAQKRKISHESDDILPKRQRKFFYLSQSMTKPRKLKKSDVQYSQADQSVTKIDNEIIPAIKQQKQTFIKIGNNGKLCLVNKLYLKSDLFFNDEKKCNYEYSKKQDLSFNIVDEISLEGLDGITVEAFWKRLKNVFPNPINKKLADRLWRTVCNNKRINICILEDPREKLITIDHSKYMDFSLGIFVEPFIEFKDIYPLCSIKGTDEVRGSCSTYETRKENNGIKKFSMDKALKMFEQRLVFVADQMLRNKALINEETDPNVEIVDTEYCMLERIGRSREHGELTQGKMALGLKTDKSTHHNRKSLVQNLLIVNQFFYLKSYTAQQNMSGGIVHLTRFYSKRKTKRVVIMEQIANFLREKPNYYAEIFEIRKMFAKDKTFVKLIKTPEFRKFFKIQTYPYRTLFPNATKHEYMNKNGVQERQVRLLRMIDPCSNVTAILEEKDVKEVADELNFDGPGHKLQNYELLRDVFYYIVLQGKPGVTMTEIQNYFKFDFYSIRMAVNKLVSRFVIDSERCDMGRQHTQKYFAKVFSFPNLSVITQPKPYYLNEKITERALKGYQTEIDESRFYKEPETSPEPEASQAHFTVYIDSISCTVFLTDIDLKNCEELTIYDIVIKGRDRLLLNHSNLIFDEYENEWENYLLQADNSLKNIEIFQNGIGKLIYGYLKSMQINLEADNKIIFDLKNIQGNLRASVEDPSKKIIEFSYNYENPHGSYFENDKISKIYLFEAMFNENHLSNRALNYLQDIYDRIMASNGKKKRSIDCSSVKTEKKIEFEVADNVIMEKFMGKNPQLLHTDFIDDGIKIDYYISTTPKTVRNFKIYQKEDDYLTERYIKRANIILSLINEHKIVKDLRPCYKAIRSSEDQEGYDIKVCNKSVTTIVTKLVQEGYIKVIKLVLNGNNSSKIQHFVALPSIPTDHALIKSTVEQIKMRFFIEVAPSHKTIKVKSKKQSPFSSSDVQESIIELKKMTVNKIDTEYKINRNIGKFYGYCPKFVRMRILHEFLFYVIREATPRERLEARDIFELCKSLKVKITGEEINEMPPIFLNEISWRSFIPALPASNNPKGWALASDIILRMPISVFVKIYNVSYEMPDLESYLNHPIKRHILLKYLPVSTRNVLLHRRKYFHGVYEIFTNLCYIGLMQLGAKNFKEKDQIFIYLNNKASLYDTCSSKPGYNTVEERDYKKLLFEFVTSSDVELYWSEMLRICMNTSLGKRKIMDGSSVIIEDCHSKPAMMELLKAKQFQQAVDDDKGVIPGDRKGAAGFDASLWTYVKRNWLWKSAIGKKTGLSDIQSIVTGLKREKMDEKGKFQPVVMSYSNLILKREHERKILKPIRKTPAKKANWKSAKITGKKKKYKRTIVARTRKKIREYYDAIDKKIMLKNRSVKVEWFKEEDQLLRFCRVVSSFLCPLAKKQFIPYNIIRDVLHRICERSKNKTARAIQRRIYSFLLNDERLKIMESNVENLMNFPEIARCFEQVRNRYKYEIKLTDAQIYVCFVYIVAFVLKNRGQAELHLLGNMASADYFSKKYIERFELIVQNATDENSQRIYTNPDSLDDITKDTIKSVMHCSIACKKNSPGWAFQLFHIYKKFPEELIRLAVMEMKKNHLLVLNKRYEDKNVNVGNNWHSPLKFSYVYNSMKNSTYSIEMYSESFSKFKKLAENAFLEPTGNDFLLLNELIMIWDKCNFVFDIPEKGVLLNPEIEDHGDVIEELAKRFRFYLVKIFEMKSGAQSKIKEVNLFENKSETVLSDIEKDVDEVKMDVRNLIFRVPYLLESNLENHFKNMMVCSSSAEINGIIFLLIVELKKCAKELGECSDELKSFIEKIDEGNGNQTALLKNLSKIVFAIQTLQMKKLNTEESEENDTKTIEEKFKIFELEELNDNVQVEEQPSRKYRRHHSNGMEECVKRASEGDFPSLEEIKEGMMTETDSENRKIPHITDLITFLTEDRFPELDGDNETIERMKDHFVIQYPKLEKFLIEEKESFMENSVVKILKDTNKISDVVKELKSIDVEGPNLGSVEDFVAEMDNRENVLKIIEDMLEFIKSKQEFGASAEEIKEKFLLSEKNLDLPKLLKHLCKIKVILRVGSTSLIFVHSEYHSRWLVETFTLKSEEKEVFESKEKNEMKKLKSLIEERLKSSVPLKIQIKPWSKLDGTWNNELFHEWLCLVLSRCLDCPNIPVLSLCQHFCFLKPVDIYFLLEVLEDLSCVEIYSYHQYSSDLFMPRRIIDNGKATCLNKFEEMYVKPVNVSGLCFGSYLDYNLELI